MRSNPIRWSAGAMWILAFALMFAVAGCEDDSTAISDEATQRAGMDSTEAVGSALGNALSANDNNTTTLQSGLGQGSQGFVGKLSNLTRNLPGLGAGAAQPDGNQGSQLTGSYTAQLNDLSGTYNCAGGGTVDVTGSATWTADWDDGLPGPSTPRFWHEAYTLSAITFTLNDCSENGYTLNGTAVFDADNEVNFDETGAPTGIFGVGLIVGEDATASITALQESTGNTFTFNLAWTLDATISAVVDTNTDETTFTSVNVTATYTVNDWTCTGTWTDIDGRDGNVTCSNN